jgi:hypothetical protein
MTTYPVRVVGPQPLRHPRNMQQVWSSVSPVADVHRTATEQSRSGNTRYIKKGTFRTENSLSLLLQHPKLLPARRRAQPQR